MKNSINLIRYFHELIAKKRSLTLAVLIWIAPAVFFSAFGQAGSLDASFDGDGIVTTPIGNANEGSYAILLQPDGKIIAAGYSNSGTPSSFDYDFAVARYNTDGSLDNTFSGDGIVTTDFGSINDYATSALLQPDGKIVVCGRSFINGNYNYGCALARYNSDGSLDNSFDSDGKVTYDINTMDEIILECAIQPDGKILAAGYSYIGSQNVFAVLRFNASGSIDNTFGTGGVSLINFGSDNARCSDITVLPGGQILTVGRAYSSSTTSDFALAQLNSNGSPDNTFGISGRVTTDLAGADDYGETFAIQPDGKIIAAGYTGNILSVTEFAMVRYSPSGAVDATFGINGRVTTALTTHDESYAIALQADSKILLAGRAFNGSYNDFGITRYNSNGTLDSTFDADGKVIIPIASGYDEAFSIAVQTDGKIVVGGRAESTNDDFAVIRLNGDMPTGTVIETSPRSNENTFVFPNPANDRVVFNNILPGKAVIKMYDLSGRVVYVSPVIEQQEFQLDISFLEPGVFLCKITGGSRTQALLLTKIKF